METEKTTKYELVEIEKIVPYANNARLHDQKQIDKVAASIREFGFLNPIIVDKNYTILCGHCRFEASKKLGLTKVPCIKEEYLTEAQKKAYILADNRTAEDAGWDDELLRIEIESLEDYAFDLSLTGFDEKELNKLFDSGKEVVDDDDFDINKALDAAAFVKPGDVWILGRHRLVCGDSTIPETVKLLMDGKKANACITDPPYACSYEGGTGMKIKNDNLKGEEFYNFLLAAFKNAYENVVDGGAFYSFHSDAEKVNFYNATVNAGFHYSTTCIWVKDRLVIGRMDYQMRHEPIIYGFKDTKSHEFYGDRKQTTVWEFDRPKKSELHPTTKPLPLIAYPMRNSTQANGIVLDLFGGSGSTLMAAEQLDRIAYLMELDPKYASAIVRRYAAGKGSINDIYVIRNGEKLPCSEVYIPTEDDLAFKDGNVDDTQRVRNE